ncbi:outer membrane protein assembly factor BamE [Xenorhabdus ishibashii]|uniref:Outer membrane protein assembly factor BamE n=1 Tax=Xenorhabdus ishibashii TaxID=1034471 RepID=A0A2D0KIF2_9GAMM|nr:outer membrane protein assembly factor BamE [Xenorhabdus ishibashii]PHM63220.1 membrane biogenesis protein [Xenorhabdus ishibashii]
MRCKLLTAATVSLVMLTAGCSMFERIVYRPDINQGNYLTPAAVSKIHKGMTQQQVSYTLGTPMLTDPFGSQTWYYVFRQQPGHGKATQETLTLTFDNQGVLTDIKDEKSLPENQ